MRLLRRAEGAVTQRHRNTGLQRQQFSMPRSLIIQRIDNIAYRRRIFTFSFRDFDVAVFPSNYRCYSRICRAKKRCSSSSGLERSRRVDKRETKTIGLCVCVYTYVVSWNALLVSYQERTVSRGRQSHFPVDVLARRPRLSRSPSRLLGSSHLQPFPRDESLFLPRRVARPRDVTSKLPTFRHVFHPRESSRRFFNYFRFIESFVRAILHLVDLRFASFVDSLRRRLS